VRRKIKRPTARGGQGKRKDPLFSRHTWLQLDQIEVVVKAARDDLTDWILTFGRPCERNTAIDCQATVR